MCVCACVRALYEKGFRHVLRQADISNSGIGIDFLKLVGINFFFKLELILLELLT